MSKVPLNTLANLDNPASAVTTINGNAQTITTAFDNTLSRDGTTPNQMGANFDMNSHRILNLPAPIQPTDVVRLQDMTTLSGVVAPIPAGGITGSVLTKNSGSDFDWSWSAYSFTGTGPVAFGAGGTVTYTSNNLSIFSATTSAQLASVISDETGTGSLVFNTSPTLVTPILGAATVTTINKVTITQPATAATLTIINNKTLTVNNSLTFAGTDGTTQTFQASDTIVGRTTTDTLTNKSISGSSNTLTNIANGSLSNSTITIGSTATSLGGTLTAATGRAVNALNIDSQTGHGDSNYTILTTDRHIFTNANFSASRTWTLPAASAVNPGQRVLIGDLQGTVTASNTLIIAPNGVDTINGTSGITLTTASTSLELISDGVSKWYAVQSGSGGSGGGGAGSVAKSYEFVATAAQTSFSGTDQNSKTLSYTPNNVQVYLGGLRLNLSDFTATNGSTVVLSLGANAGALVTIVDYGSGGGSSFSQYEYNSTAAQTTFSGADVNSKTLAYTVGFVLVYANGDLLNQADYTATNGTSIVFAIGRALNDQIKIVAMNQSAVALIPANNLSDVASASVARANIGAAVNDLQNVSFAVSASAGALTIALKDANGNDATSTTPIALTFRNASLTASPNTPTTLQINSAASVVVPSTSTLGTLSAVGCRLWITGWNDSGTFRLGVFNASTASNIFALTENGVASSLQVVAAGNSAGQHYTAGAAVTSKAFRILGYVDWNASGVATAGTWTITNLNSIVTFSPGIKKPGDVVQVAPLGQSASSATFTGTSFGVISGGITSAISPTSAANLIRVRTMGSAGLSVVGSLVIQLSRGSTLIGTPTGASQSTATGAIPIVALTYDAPNTTSSTTYQLQGKVSAGTGAYPAGSAVFATPGASIEVEEIMG